MRWLGLALALCLLAAHAGAESIPIRTGEHDGFSRLVLPLAQPAEGWTFGRLDDGYQLRLGRGGVTFDLSRVFDKIPKTRLAAISANDAAGQLTLRLGCACHAEIFAFRETLLVIDIRPGPAPRNSPFERALETASAPAPPAEETQAEPPPNQPNYDWRKASVPALPAPPPPLIAATEAPNPAVDEARAALLKQLARAGIQGLIEVDPKRLDLPGQSEEAPGNHTGTAPHAATPGSKNVSDAAKSSHPTTASAPHAGAAPSAPPAPQQDAPLLGLRTRTVMDTDAPARPDPGHALQGGACPPDSGFAVQSWASDDKLAAQIAPRRRALLGEFDRAGAESAADLARTYLHFGFGAEARSVLAAFPGAGGSARPTLLAIAAILDDEQPALTRPLAGLAACDGQVALWSMLASPPPAPGEPVNTGAVLRNFSGLPLHLRRLLGPRLSKVFLDLGATEAAHALRNSITRAPGDHGAAVPLLDARIDMAEGHPERAEKAVDPVIAEDGPLSPEAMILLVEARVAQGEPVEPRRVEALAALAHEQRGTAMGARLTRAQALAMASLGQFDEAFATIGQDREGLTRLWEMLATKGTEEALIQAAMTVPDLRIGPPTRLRIADRLLGLGFPDPAAAWLAPGTVPDAEREFRLAQAALARRDGTAALALLDARDDPDSQRLRAQALALTGAHGAAAEVYGALGAGDRQGAEAWRAGDWETARSAGSELQKKALTLQTTPSALPESAGELGRGKALVSGSKAARDALAKLLASHDPAAPAPE